MAIQLGLKPTLCKAKAILGSRMGVSTEYTMAWMSHGKRRPLSTRQLCSSSSDHPQRGHGVAAGKGSGSAAACFTPDLLLGAG